LESEIFADAVRDRTKPYTSVEFEGFRRTFELVREVPRAAAEDLARNA
jgi:hypothetical protein